MVPSWYETPFQSRRISCPLAVTRPASNPLSVVSPSTVGAARSSCPAVVKTMPLKGWLFQVGLLKTVWNSYRQPIRPEVHDEVCYVLNPDDGVRSRPGDERLRVVGDRSINGRNVGVAVVHAERNVQEGGGSEARREEEEAEESGPRCTHAEIQSDSAVPKCGGVSIYIHALREYVTVQSRNGQRETRAPLPRPAQPWAGCAH